MKLIKKIYHFLIAYLSYWLYGRPSKKIIVVGVTGTKGKSTTAKLIASVLQAGGYKTGLMTTVEYQIGDRHILNKDKMTMLGRGKIQKMLQSMVKAGCKYAVIETSSEGIMQYRHLALNYDIAVFTNLGTEHSERHGGFENLKKDKGKLFAALQNTKIIDDKKIEKVIVANVDDKNSDYYLDFKTDKKISYSLEKDSDTKAIEIKSNNKNSEFKVDDSNYKINLIGKFNIYNSLAAIAVGKSQKISDKNIQLGLEEVKKVEGRMEFIDEGQDFKVVVDYAHEPLSYTALFTELRNVLCKDNKIISVIGSDGGGRDKTKREKMGEIAAELTDTVIITDVNCFDEDPKQIAEMLAIGARRKDKKEGQDLFIEVDRKKAIKKAFSLANQGDVVAITAKGTEPCIVVANGEKIPWDDREVSRELLKNNF
jgi:UDP-N-acetylmuramoyl-L-alanyl-D-glutamate--2,6-diaminopimelate ligase